MTSYSMPSSHLDERHGQFQTELLDISDFDGSDEVSVKIQVEGDRNADFRIYDLVIGGWRK